MSSEAGLQGRGVSVESRIEFHSRPCNPAEETFSKDAVGGLAAYDKAFAQADKSVVKVAGGQALWSRIKNGAWKRCEAINDERFAKWKSEDQAKGQQTAPEPADDIPL